MWNSPVSKADKISPSRWQHQIFVTPLTLVPYHSGGETLLPLDLWALAGRCPGWLITALNDSALIHTPLACSIGINKYIRVAVEFAIACSNIDTLGVLGRDWAEAEPGNHWTAACGEGKKQKILELIGSLRIIFRENVVTFLWRFKPSLSASLLVILSLYLSFIFENIGY